MKSNYTEYDVIRALDDIANGKHIRKVSREWGVPYSTLRSRLNNPNTRNEGASYLQRLPKLLEDRLTDWVFT
jgi:lambda repressor-like predicted transcriptional regulator